ncbi:hypothetical protein ACNDH3_004226 [Escherichia coli]
MSVPADGVLVGVWWLLLSRC